MKYVGVDIGSSSLKGAILDLDQLTISMPERIAAPKPLPGLPTWHFEIAPLEIVSAARELITSLVRSIDDCAGIVCCTQMSGVILVQTDGTPVSNYISWRDQRVLESHPTRDGTYYDVVRRLLSPEDLERLGECRPGSPTSLLFWLAENGLLSPNVTPLCLADFVAMQLAGAPPCTEYTNAVGALDLNTGSWHQEAFSILGIADLSWPPLCTPHHAIGEFMVDNVAIPFFPAVGDQQCALVGAQLSEGELSINVSTGSQLSEVFDTYRPGEYQVRPYFDGRYLNTITHLPAGRSLTALVELLTEIPRARGIEITDPWEYISEQSSQSSDMQADLAFFQGPMGSCGSLNQLTLDNLKVGNLFHAAFTNMADNYATCSQQLSAGREWSSLVLSGGLPQRCPVLRDLITSRFDCPHRICTASEETLAGLLTLALVASGRAPSVTAAIRQLSPQNLSPQNSPS